MRLHQGASFADLLDGRYLDKWQSERPAARFGDRDPLVVVHVPKTAGSALRSQMNRWFRERVALPHDAMDREFSGWLERDHGKREFVQGHVEFRHVQQALDHARGFTFATLVRHPVSRAISHYKYCMSERHPGHRRFRERFPTMQAWLDWGQMSRDFQARNLCGEVEGVDECLDKLRAIYHFVGLAEAFDASMSLFALAWGRRFQPPKAPENTAAERRPQQLDIPADVEQQLLDQNPIDLALHDHVRRLYESQLENLVSWSLRR